MIMTTTADLFANHQGIPGPQNNRRQADPGAGVNILEATFPEVRSPIHPSLSREPSLL